MKKSTKILIILTIILLIPNIFLFRHLFDAIVPTPQGFVFNFSTWSYVALGVFVAFTIVSTILYIIFLKSLSLQNQLFFSILPLTVNFGFFVVYISNINNLEDLTSQSVRNALNIDNAFNSNAILWIVVAILMYVVLLFILILFSCLPLKKVERVTAKLGDGRVKMDDFKVGGNKQFQNIEHSLNKINHIYKEKENKIKVANFECQKYMPKQILKFFEKNDIKELELGKKIQKNATILFCNLKNDSKKILTLEENFNYINSYFKFVAPLIKRFDGFIDKFSGECVLACFGNSKNAIECSNAILKGLGEKNKKSKFEPNICLFNDIFTFSISGDEERKIPSIENDVFSVMGKMQELSSFVDAKFLLSKKVLESLPPKYDFKYRYIGKLTVEKEKIELFEGLDAFKKSKRDKLLKFKNQFEDGVRLYDEKKFKEAKERFEFVLHGVKDDKASFVYFNKASEKLKDKNG